MVWCLPWRHAAAVDIVAGRVREGQVVAVYNDITKAKCVRERCSGTEAGEELAQLTPHSPPLC